MLHTYIYNIHIFIVTLGTDLRLTRLIKDEWILFSEMAAALKGPRWHICVSKSMVTTTMQVPSTRWEIFHNKLLIMQLSEFPSLKSSVDTISLSVHHRVRYAHLPMFPGLMTPQMCRQAEGENHTPTYFHSSMKTSLHHSGWWKSCYPWLWYRCVFLEIDLLIC